MKITLMDNSRGFWTEFTDHKEDHDKLLEKINQARKQEKMTLEVDDKKYQVKKICGENGEITVYMLVEGVEVVK